MITNRLRRIIRKRFAQRFELSDDWLAYRAAFKGRIDDCTENGQIAIVRTGHDCDHCHYSSVNIVDAPRSFFAFMKAEEKHREWLDGPESIWIDRPSNTDGNFYQSRDVAAEMAGY